MNWSHPNPIFIDFETQSQADIQEIGGRLYVEHPSTRILMCSVYIDGSYHLWIPDYIKVDTRQWTPETLWPNELKPHNPVRLYRGTSLPDEIQTACLKRPCVAHNAYGFDSHVWTRFCKGRPEWLDSVYLARLSNRSGRLDTISKNMLGVGKDRAKKLLPLLTQSKVGMFGEVVPPAIKAGDLQAFSRYAIGDIEILRRLWGELSYVEVESDVIQAHNNINERGVKVDIPLLQATQSLSRYSTNEAATTIAYLTKGKIPPDKLRSTKVVHEWLESHGVIIVDENRLDKSGKPKPCLRKEIVQRYIDSPYLIDDHLRAIREIPPVVLDVLKLRLKALRITDAKVKRAQLRVSKDGRIRDVHAYAIAGTRRFSSSGVQVHNLPKPNSWLNKNLQKLVELVTTFPHNDVRKLYERIQEELPIPEPGESPITVDDVCSAFVRPSIIPQEGNAFIIVDWSQIEARGIALIAGERKLLKLFAENGDPYTDFASRAYSIPTDTVNSDQRNVGKIAILGLGYGMGAEKMRIFAANSGVDLVKAGITAQYLVDTYRDTYTSIAGWKPDRNESYRVGGIWKDLDKAVKDTVANRVTHHCGRCKFHMREKDLICTLPSGGMLYYPNARIEDVIPPYVWTLNLPPNPKATVVYDSTRGVKSLFGGLIAENIVQAISRDLLATALVRLDQAGFNPVLHVHDEIICEVPKHRAESLLRPMMDIMREPPSWAEDFPVACEGYVSPRFVKKSWEGFKKLDSRSF